MDRLRKQISYRRRGAALLIVLAMVVLLTGLCVAYLSRTTSDRQVAHGSFNQSKADQLVASAMDNIIGDLRQEIANGSVNLVTPGAMPTVTPAYSPAAAANMVPQRSGNAAGVPNLIRRSVRSDPIPAPGLSSVASAVNSTTDISSNGRYVTAARWNTHYLVPKKNTGTDDSIPIDAFANATPDWVFVTSDTSNQTAGRKVITSPDQTVIGRYAYAVYDEGGLLDTNVAGYPTGTTAIQSGRKGSTAFADLTALATSDAYRLGNPDANGVYQMDMLVGWRNYATTQPTNTFPTTGPPANKAFAYNFQTDPTRAAAFFGYVLGNTNGFLGPNPSATPWNVNNNGTALRTDQNFVQRQELTAFRKAVGSTTSFSTNALQYLGTFSRETNSPSFSPPLNASEMGGNDQGGTYAYRTNASSPTAVNPSFLLRRVTNVPSGYKRFDGTTPVVGEPLVKTRFPLSRLAWITYNGPSALRTLPPQTPTLTATDPNYDMWALQWTYGIPAGYLQAGTAANIKACFGLTWAGSPTYAWTYTNPTGTTAAPSILRLDQVATAGREADFFELLQAAILSGSLGQSTAPPPGTSGGGVTGGSVFPDIHMSNTTHHILTIGACVIDQASPSSIPTRIEFNPSGTIWTAYGVKNLPYITQLYPIAGPSPTTSTQWATYLLFQLWNPHQNASASTPAVRLRVDGHVGIFAGGGGQNWTPGSAFYTNGNGQSVTINPAAFSVPAALTTTNVTSSVTWPGSQGAFAVLVAPPTAP